MKQFNKSKLCALVTTAAVFMSNTAVLPSINTFAADGDAKTATITLTDNWSRMLTFTDIPQAEEKTTTVTLGQDYTKTLTYTADDEYQQLWDETTESGNWDFNAENSRDAIITAIEADGITLPEEPSFVINNITATYSWTLTSANGESLTNATVSFGSYGDDIDINSEDNQKTLTETSGTETVKVSELVTTGGTIENFGGLYIHAGATGNTGDTFTFEVTSVVLDVTYLDGENGGYKGLYDETIQLSNWHFAAHSPNEDAGDRSADIVAALKAETGDETAHWAIQITDMTVNYSWELTTTRVSDNYNIDFNPNPMGMTPAGSETWFEAGIQNGNYTLLEAKSGTGSVKASDVMAKSGVTVEDIHCMDINGGMWTDNPADTLTIKVTGITLNVTYTIEKPPVEAYVSYSDVQDAEYLSITCDVSTQAECGHENHIADDGTDYWAGQTYCPWPEVSMNKVDADGNWSDAYYNQWSTNNNVTTPSDDGGSINFMFPMSDIITALGTLSSGEQYVISGNSVNTIKYEFLAAKPDMILGTGSYEGGTIEEAMEFDPETNSEVATGIPNITPSFAIAEYENAVSFNGYDAIKIDYTAKSPEACYGVLVVLHGWEDNSTGWMEKFYAIEENGSIVIDLSSMQDKVFHNIYVGPVAPANSKIGDTFTPGFAVTSAKMVTSYDGSFTNEIAKPVPDEPTTEPETPTTSYTVKTTTTENGTVSVDKAAAAKGDTVTITAKPADGYEVDTITVTGASGDVTVTDNAFTMPDEEVTITVTFKATAVEPTSYTVKTTTTENGTVSVDKAAAAKGDTVTITAKPADGYEVDTITVTGASGDVTVTDNAFTMPDEEVTITVTFKAIVVEPTPTPTPTPTPSVPSTPAPSTPPTTPSVAPEKTEKAEEVVEEAIEEAKANSTVEIKIDTKETKITAEIFLEAKGKNITLEISLDNGVTWKIEADNISDKAADVDIDVDINTKNVPSKEVEKVADGNETMQISLAHNGEFGFKATLEVPVAKKHNNKVANLFHYKNDKEFEFIASGKVKNGKVSLPFTHASEYVVVFADEAMGDDVSSAAEIYSDSITISETDSNSTDVKIFVLVFATIAFAGFAAARKIKQK